MLTTRSVEALRFELMAREHVLRIGARIKNRREELGLSQKQVADRMPGVAVDGNYISRWERGVVKPGDEHMDSLAKALETSVAGLLTDPPDKSKTPDLSRGPSELDQMRAELAATRVEIGTLATQLEEMQRLLGQIAKTVGVTTRNRKAN